MVERFLGCDALCWVYTKHLLHDIIELSIARPHNLLQSLAVANMPSLGRWETVWILKGLIGSEIGALLRDHFSRDLAADVLDKTEVFVGVVDGEEKVRGVELKEHAADGPEISWERPAVLKEDLWGAVLTRLDERLMLSTGRGAACTAEVNDLDASAVASVHLKEDIRELEVGVDKVVSVHESDSDEHVTTKGADAAHGEWVVVTKLQLLSEGRS